MSQPAFPAVTPMPPAAAGDAFACVQAAVLQVWSHVGDQQRGPTTPERNLMLDVCGSDHRPLVDLVLDLGRTVRPALESAQPDQGRGPLSPEAWTHLRAAHVHRIVATRYLQHEVARWAVDVWGAALGLAPRIEVVVARPGDAMSASPRAAASSAATQARPTPTGVNARAATTTPASGVVRVPASKLGVPPTAVPPALRNVPSWAGGPVSFGVGQRPKASTLAALAVRGRVVVQHGHSGPVGPMWQPAERRAAVVFAALLTICGGSLWVALDGRRSERTAAQPGPAGEAPAAAAGARSVVTPTLAAPTVAPTVAPPSDGAPAVTTSSAASTQSAPPSVRDDHPVAIGYNLVPLPAARSGEPSGATTSVGVRERGVGGRYRVEQRIRDVSGTENCDAVARALGAGRVTEEVITHVAGAREFVLASRGVRGTLTADGYFVAEPSAGSMNNVMWQFRMRGRFTPNGFAGESETLTDATIRWGRQQTCVVTADLTATRLTSESS